MSRIVVGMSGGVDSSVTASILKEQGHEIIGLFMHNWEEQDSDGVCCATSDYEDVRRVCGSLDIPYASVNFAKEYKEQVFEYFLDEYRAWRTPNPDVLCNREIKFAHFIEHAKKLGGEYFATGHYCGIRQDGNIPVLLRSKDSNKDQTYFLNQVRTFQLKNVLFPLENIDKPDVRRLAEKYNLVTANKKDSTGICFIGERNFRTFLQSYLPNVEGNIEDLDGRIVGRHIGLMYYTLGQRKGLGIGGDVLTTGGRWFVVHKDLKRNVLIVSCGDETPLYKSRLITDEFNFITIPGGIGKESRDAVVSSGANLVVGASFEAFAQIRHRQPPQKVVVKILEGGCVQVDFEIAQRAITEGQYCVLYSGECAGDVCFGGGKIVKIP